MVAVIALIGKKHLWFCWCDVHQWIKSRTISSLTAGQVEAERAAFMVTEGVDFARKAAA